MTDKPTTLSIDPRKWRLLFADNMQITADFMGRHATLSAEELHELLGYLDEAKLMAKAWYQAAQPKAEIVQPQPITNGQTPPKRRGRPPGSGKKQRMSPRVMQ